MSYEESYAKAFPFDKMVPGMLDSEMIKDTAKIVNEAMADKVQVNFIINNRAGGNRPPDCSEDRRSDPFGKTAAIILILLMNVGNSEIINIEPKSQKAAQKAVKPKLTKKGERAIKVRRFEGNKPF